MGLFTPVIAIIHLLGHAPEWRAEDMLRAWVWWLIVGFLALGMLGAWEYSSYCEATENAHHKLDEWLQSMSAAFVARQVAMEKMEPMRDKKAITGMREGPNGTRAWVSRVSALNQRADESFSALRERVTLGLDMVKRGWWEAEEHFRLFHTHDRGSSPLIRMNLPISITTRDTNWHSLSDMLLMRSLLPSLLRTMEAGYQYGVYVGYDVGDPLLDQPGAEQSLIRMWNDTCKASGKNVALKLFRYNDTRNYNVWAVNYITKEAYLDGYDYFFRVNDDSEFRGSGWTSRLVEALQLNEDFGAAGVLDEANPRIWTHSVVGRPHIEIFGFHFPFSFGNWWSDDWITFAYSRRFSLWLYDVDIYHHRHSARYSVNWDDYEKRLSTELARSEVRWKHWLCKTRDLSEFCGPLDLAKEAQLSEVKMDNDARKGLDRLELMAMEKRARDEQFARMGRFTTTRKQTF
jgi:hypothetical protein